MLRERLVGMRENAVSVNVTVSCNCSLEVNPAETAPYYGSHYANKVSYSFDTGKSSVFILCRFQLKTASTL